MTPFRFTFLLLLGPLCFFACSNRSPAAPNETDLQPPTVDLAQFQLSIVSGNGQTGRVGEPLEHPFEVQVLDGAGNLIADRDVIWGLVAGGGTVSGTPIELDGVPGGRTVISTNSSGIATARLTFSAEPGLRIVEAMMFFGEPRVQFQARAVSE